MFPPSSLSLLLLNRADGSTPRAESEMEMCVQLNCNQKGIKICIFSIILELKASQTSGGEGNKFEPKRKIDSFLKQYKQTPIFPQSHCVELKRSLGRFPVLV